MGIFEAITHKEEIEDLLNEAELKYNKSFSEFEKQKKKTTSSLEKLGKTKIIAWEDSMDEFVQLFGAFNNIEMNRVVDTRVHLKGYDVDPYVVLDNMQVATLNAQEIKKVGFAALGTGALVGVAAYGGAMMFAKASTGTAIAALTGAAKTNATLAWFGGGAIKKGGLGIIGGKVMLAGIVVLPILAVSGVIAAAKGKQRLAEAKKINAEAREAAAQLSFMTTGLSGIEKMSNNYEVFIKQLNRKFKHVLAELENIKNRHTLDEYGFINFNELNKVEQQTLHISWLVAQVLYHALSVPIMTDDGNLSEEASLVLSEAQKDFKTLRNQTFKLSGQEAHAANMLWKSDANVMVLVNFLAMALFMYCGILRFPYSVFGGILCFVSAIAAFPYFVKIKDLPSNRLYSYRIIRLIIAFIIFAIAIVL